MSDRHEHTPYDLERPVNAPDLPGEVFVHQCEHDAVGALAADLLLHAHNCVRAFGDFHLCLSGDDEIEPALLRLLTDPAYRELPWRRTHLWRFAAGAADPSAGNDLIHETITIHADLPPEQAHAIDVSRPDAAAWYERELRETLAWREKGHDRLDCALLTPGALPADWANGEDADALVRTYAERVACTRRLINASRLIVMFATGERSRGPIAEATMDAHPMSALDPIGGVLRWRLDEEACGGA